MPKRSQGLRLDPSVAAPVIQEPVALGKRDRLGIPYDVANGLAWLKGPYVLGVLDEPGRILLFDWATQSPSVLSHRAQLIQSSEWELLKLLEDRYRRIQIAEDYRITMTLAYILHLKLPPDANSYVHVSRIEDSIEIVSTEYRDKQLAKSCSAFPDLP